MPTGRTLPISLRLTRRGNECTYWSSLQSQCRSDHDLGGVSPFLEKVEIIQAAIQVQEPEISSIKGRDLQHDWDEWAIKAINGISEYNGIRNIIAHHPFHADDVGNVVFRHAKIDAKTKSLKQGPVTYTTEDLDKHCTNMENTRLALEKIRGGLMSVIFGIMDAQEAPDTASMNGRGTVT